MMKITDIKKQKNNSWTFLIDGFEMLIEIFSHNNYSIMIYNNTVGGYEQVQPDFASKVFNQFDSMRMIV